jgi:hypothetical protein
MKVDTSILTDFIDECQYSVVVTRRTMPIAEAVEPTNAGLG